MGINKGTLAKEVNGTIEYIYPKTSADMVEYTTGVNAQSKITELASTVDNINARVNNLILNATNGNNSAELVDMRTSGFSSKVYDLAGNAVREMINKIAPVNFKIDYSFDSTDTIGQYVLSKCTDIDNTTGIPLQTINGSSLSVSLYNKANNNLLLTKENIINNRYSVNNQNKFWWYSIYFTYAEFDLFKNITVYPIFTYTPGNGDPAKVLNCKNVTTSGVVFTQSDLIPLFDYSGISTT